MDLYSSSVPFFEHYLGQLAHVLKKLATHCEERNLEPMDLLSAQLAEDMLPLGTQVTVAVNMVKRCLFPLVGQSIPELHYDVESVDQLVHRVEEVKAWASHLTPDAFVAPTQGIDYGAGEATGNMSAQEYLQMLILPNFLFHFSMVYAIARHNGVSLGKGDFDGLHYHNPSTCYV